MATAHCNGSSRAVLYLRMSSDQQETSIDDQRSELERYARKQGYSITGEYLDEAISGDDTHRRSGFLRMRDDCTSGAFDLVLCWDQDRFGRFDLLDAGHWIMPFRESGIRLETVAQGRIDWEDLVGQLIYSVNQMGKAQFLRDLSRNVCRGQLSKAREGKGTGGNRIPYGYRVERVFDEKGKLLNHYLVVDQKPAEIVQRIFRDYLDGGSVRSVAAALNADKIPGPTGGQWNTSGIDYVLRNQKYVGSFVFGLQGVGKYHTACNGEVAKRNKHDRPIKGKPIIHQNNHEALVNEATFDRVQRRLKDQSRDTRPKKYRHFVLSGLLRCGDCGGSMCGVKSTSKSGCQRYLCRAYGMRGKAACFCNSIAEESLVEALVGKIEELYLSDNAAKRLKRAIRSEQDRSTPAPKNLAKLRRKIEALDQELDQGAKRILKAPDHLVDRLMSKLDELGSERDQLSAELQAVESTEKPDRGASEKEVERAIEALSGLRKAFRKAKPAELSELLRAYVDRIELFFDHRTRGKLNRSEFREATVYVRPEIVGSQLCGTRLHYETG